MSEIIWDAPEHVETNSAHVAMTTLMDTTQTTSCDETPDTHYNQIASTVADKKQTP